MFSSMSNRGAFLLSELMGTDAQKRRVLGVQLCTSDQTIRSWLHGRFLPKTKHRSQIAALYGVPILSWDEPTDTEQRAA